jgi:hypothetical protein
LQQQPSDDCVGNANAEYVPSIQFSDEGQIPPPLVGSRLVRS